MASHHSLTFAGFSVRLQGEANGAAAAHPRGRILARPVTAAVVDGAGLCADSGDGDGDGDEDGDTEEEKEGRKEGAG